MDDNVIGEYKIDTQVRFKTTMLKSSFSDYSYPHIVVKETITITGAGSDPAAQRADKRNKQVTFKNCAPFTNWINQINNIQIDNAIDLDVVMPMYDLIEYNNNYEKTSGSL